MSSIMSLIDVEARVLQRPLDLIRRHPGDASLVLMLAAGLAGAYSQWVLPARHGGEMWNLAWNLADHSAFANPFTTLDTGPAASNPPLAPLITAGLIRVFRVPFLIYVSSSLLSILANALSAALLPKLSRVFFGDIIPGVLAAVLWLFSMQVIPGWDTNYTAAGLISFACLTASLVGNETRHPKTLSFVAGVLAAALCLLNPASMLIWVPWIAYLLWRMGIYNRGAMKACGAIVGVAFIVVAGWCMRNHRAIGAFVIRTGMGIELYVSNNDCAQPTIMEEEVNGCFRKLHPNSNVQEAREYRRLGEVQYNKVRTEDAIVWIRAHPSRFAELSWARFLGFWFPAGDSIPNGFAFQEDFGVHDYMRKWNSREHRIACAMSIGTALSLLGLAFMVHERRPVAWFVVTSMALYPLMYYVTIGDVRYRYPTLWVTLLPAGYFLTKILGVSDPHATQTV